jgi:hypothetical protein
MRTCAMIHPLHLELETALHSSNVSMISYVSTTTICYASCARKHYSQVPHQSAGRAVQGPYSSGDIALSCGARDGSVLTRATLPGTP